MLCLDINTRKQYKNTNQETLIFCCVIDILLKHKIYYNLEIASLTNARLKKYFLSIFVLFFCINIETFLNQVLFSKKYYQNVVIVCLKQS